METAKTRDHNFLPDVSETGQTLVTYKIPVPHCITNFGRKIKNDRPQRSEGVMCSDFIALQCSETSTNDLHSFYSLEHTNGLHFCSTNL